jgi:hypothetical protein
MKIKNLFTGVVSTERGDIARALIRQGMCEALEPDTEAQKPSRTVAPGVTVDGDGTVRQANGDSYRLPKPGDAKPPQVVWAVDTLTHGRESTYVAIFRSVHRGAGLGDTLWCAFPPDSIHDRADHRGRPFCSVFGCPIPADILTEYTKQWKSNSSLRMPYRTAVKVRKHPNDRAQVETGVINAAAAGVTEGASLAQLPGDRINGRT